MRILVGGFFSRVRHKPLVKFAVNLASVSWAKAFARAFKRRFFRRLFDGTNKAALQAEGRFGSGRALISTGIHQASRSSTFRPRDHWRFTVSRGGNVERGIEYPGKARHRDVNIRAWHFRRSDVAMVDWEWSEVGPADPFVSFR